LQTVLGSYYMATKRDAFLPPSKLHEIEHGRLAQMLRGLLEPISIAIVVVLSQAGSIAYILLREARLEGINLGRFQSGRRPIARRSRATSRTNEELYA
jgi:hypothetical protein